MDARRPLSRRPRSPRRRPALLAATSLAALLVAPACQQLIGADAFDFDRASPSPTGAVGGSGGSVAATSTGGGGAPPSAECAEPADCPGIESTCSFRTCTDGVCGTSEAMAGTPCTEDGGRTCNGDGACVPCLDTADCGDASQVCVKQACVATSCADGELGEDEVDVDCGGSCAPCETGSQCTSATDCDTGFCREGAGGGGGSGGTTGATCEPCVAAADCADVPDRFCDAGTCTPTLAGGEPCTGDTSCGSGFCVDGVCCDGACDGDCEACVSFKTGAAHGVCAPIPDGSDPDQECGLFTCDGAGSCSLL